MGWYACKLVFFICKTALRLKIKIIVTGDNFNLMTGQGLLSVWGFV